MFRAEHTRTPSADGFAMPAEWQRHTACWMAWPYEAGAWRGHHREAKRSVATLANAISEFEPVKVLVPAEAHIEASRFLGSGVTLVSGPLDDAWTRDTCPSFLLNGAGCLAGVKWPFNGWGGLPWANWQRDKDLAMRVCCALDIPCYVAPLINEGGAVHVDGEGTVLCTRATVLDPHRNPQLTEERAARILCDYLGAEKVIWLDHGYEQDETGGHIDVVASFVSPGKVMHLCTDDCDDPNYAIFESNIRRLEETVDARGRRLQVVRMPQPSRWYEGLRRISCSYVNYYLANNALFVPLFDEARDEQALAIFKEQYPGREIVDMPEAAAVFYGGGGVHCVTQQQPAVANERCAGIR